MRLARLAAVGLAIGVIAGFAIALLRPRPHATPDGSHPSGSDHQPTDSPTASDSALWAQFQRAEQPSVLDVRAPRRVTG
jgi:hypothetical protein